MAHDSAVIDPAVDEDASTTIPRKKTAREKIEEFIGLYSEWLARRAQVQADEGMTDDERDAVADREDELARLITTTPALESWMIERKIEILDYYQNQDVVVPGDLAVMLAGIKADIMRLEICPAVRS